jgi:CubicO group peptidase (beta-lactamase class C family)
MVSLTLSLGMFLVGPVPVPAQGVDRAEIRTILKDALKAFRVPGVAVAVVYRGKVVFLEGAGFRDLKTKKPVTAGTVFPLASCSKAFTTAAMAMLVDEGKMKWDHPVRKHVEFFRLSDPLADANVTLRDLVSHRTGLAPHDLLWYRAPWSQEEMIRRIGRVKLSKSFRSAFQYQSIMVMAAGRAVAAAAKQPWEEFVRRRIFRPLGMKNASVTTTAALKAADHASPHRETKDGRIEVIPWYSQTTPNPSGSVNASARDLANWLLFHLNKGVFRGKRLVSAKNLEETHTPQTIMRMEGTGKALQPFTDRMTYGMAWVVQDYRGQLLVSHGGVIDGFRAHLTLVPHAGLGIALLNNLHNTQMNLAVSNAIVDSVLGLKPVDWNDYVRGVVKKEKADAEAEHKRWRATRRKGTKPSLRLAAYAGTYVEPAYGTARLAVKDGALVWEWSSFRGKLAHFHYDTFMTQLENVGDFPVVFRLGADGEVAGMKFLDVDFKKKKP